MPEIYVYAVEGRTLDQKRALVQDITAAVVKHFKVAPETVMVQIVASAFLSRWYWTSTRPPRSGAGPTTRNDVRRRLPACSSRS